MTNIQRVKLPEGWYDIFMGSEPFWVDEWVKTIIPKATVIKHSWNNDGTLTIWWKRK